MSARIVIPLRPTDSRRQGGEGKSPATPAAGSLSWRRRMRLLRLIFRALVVAGLIALEVSL